MVGLIRKCAAALAALAGGFALSGCMTIQAVEPVINPPGIFQSDSVVKVEFVHPAMVGLRCAERGAKFLGMPGLNSGACSDETLMTLPNPCATVTAGWYAKVLCHELAHANGWSADHAEGSYFRKQAPIMAASESPQAIAARARTQLASADESVQLATADPANALGYFPVAQTTLTMAELPASLPVALAAGPDDKPRPLRVSAVSGRLLALR